MKIQILGKTSVKFCLDCSDLQKYGLCFDSMDYNNAHTKHIIWELLDIAKSENGFNSDGAKLHIQVYPAKKGGLEMYITKLPELCGAYPDSAKSSIYIFDDFDSALSGLRLAYRASDECRIYYGEKQWYLVCRECDAIGEYGKKAAGEFWEPYLSEHGKLIISERDVADVFRYF